MKYFDKMCPLQGGKFVVKIFREVAFLVDQCLNYVLFLNAKWPIF